MFGLLCLLSCKIDYNGTHNAHGFPDIHVPAPFGYLYELEVMKDSAKVQFKDKIKSKEKALEPFFRKMMKKINCAWICSC